MKTVKDLIEELSKLNPDLLVGISSDEEGNSKHAWSGDISFAIYDEEEYRGDQFQGYIYNEDDDETVVDAATATAIVIWP